MQNLNYLSISQTENRKLVTMTVMHLQPNPEVLGNVLVDKYPIIPIVTK